jgi:hypothetical protein
MHKKMDRSQNGTAPSWRLFSFESDVPAGDPKGEPTIGTIARGL